MTDTNTYQFSFTEGAIPSQRISDELSLLYNTHNIGAHSIFIGQVRADVINGKNVSAIEYTANTEMATEIMNGIFHDAELLYKIISANIIHSLEKVNAGEICLMVLISSGHREQSFKATEYIVERLKKELPVWGKEILQDQTHSWKVNK